MSKHIDDLIIGCYKAEAMGFKTFNSEKSGKTLSVLSLVLPDYSAEAGYIPIELDVWFSFKKKDGSFNEYAVKEVNDAGKALGSRELADMTSGNALQLRKIPLRGRLCFIHIYNLAFSRGNYSSAMRKCSILPYGAYPALEDVIGDDVPFDFPTEANTTKIGDKLAIPQAAQETFEEETCAFTGETIKKKIITEKIGQRSQPEDDLPF